MSKRWPDKIVVGLTGNIATGKSVIMRLAAEQGALTLDADQTVHEIMDADPSMQAAIEASFGPEVRKADGRINRPALAAVVFNDPEALRDLELLIHPAVRQVLFERISSTPAKIVFIEAIKLLEGGLASECDQIWVTRCPEINQIERLMICRGMDEESAMLRVRAQGPQEEKVARADVVIDTHGTMADTRRYFEMAWERLTQAGAVSSVSAGNGQRATSVTPKRPAPESGASNDVVPPPVVQGGAALEGAHSSEVQDAPTAEMSLQTGEPRPSTADRMTVRRARPADIPAILLLIHRATDGAAKMKRGELLMALGERGYLIGQEGMEISAVVGWSSENLVARIDHMYVYPLEAVDNTGEAVLDEIEHSANQLICEVILACLPKDTSPEVRRLFVRKGFADVDLGSLPKVWRAAVAETQAEDGQVMMKVLRDTGRI